MGELELPGGDKALSIPPLLIVKGNNMGDTVQTKRLYGFDSRLVQGPIRVEEWQKTIDGFGSPAVWLCHPVLPTGSLKA